MDIRYYEIRAQIHAQELSRNTLESQLAMALYLMEQHDISNNIAERRRASGKEE